MIKWWKVNVKITLEKEFNNIIIVKAQTDDEAKVRAYNKAKRKYKDATNIKILSIKAV